MRSESRASDIAWRAGLHTEENQFIAMAPVWVIPIIKRPVIIIVVSIPAGSIIASVVV